MHHPATVQKKGERLERLGVPKRADFVNAHAQLLAKAARRRKARHFAFSAGAGVARNFRFASPPLNKSCTSKKKM